MRDIHHSGSSNNLLEILEKILDKGIVIAGDIKVSLVNIELLTIKIRLIVASVDKAREIGLDWWEKDPYLSTRAKEFETSNERIEKRLRILEQKVGNDG